MLKLLKYYLSIVLFFFFLLICKINANLKTTCSNCIKKLSAIYPTGFYFDLRTIFGLKVQISFENNSNFNI